MNDRKIFKNWINQPRSRRRLAWAFSIVVLGGAALNVLRPKEYFEDQPYVAGKKSSMLISTGWLSCFTEIKTTTSEGVLLEKTTEMFNWKGDFNSTRQEGTQFKSFSISRTGQMRINGKIVTNRDPSLLTLRDHVADYCRSVRFSFRSGNWFVSQNTPNGPGS